jgi:2'-5' RNA ligase
VRLFVALELPPPVLDELVRWQLSQGVWRESLRPVEREALHVTLSFLGEVSRESLPVLRNACELSSRGSAHALALGPGVWLPRRRPRALVAAIEDDEGALRELQARLAAALVAAELLRPESRLFFPHVTVARVRSGGRVRPGPVAAPAPLEFAAEHITLFRSHLSSGPVRYERLFGVRLSGP